MAGPAELLWPARVGDGVPQRRRSAPAPAATADRAAIDATAAAAPLRCTHYEAFRSFTAEFVPPDAPQRATQADREQPGCLHANMDLSILLTGRS